MYVTFPKLLTTGCTQIWTKNIKNAPKMDFSPICDPPQDFFQKSGSVTFVLLWSTKFMQKIRKNQWAVSAIFKDARTTDQQTRAITKDPLGKPGVQNFNDWWKYTQVLTLNQSPSITWLISFENSSHVTFFFTDLLTFNFMQSSWKN